MTDFRSLCAELLSALENAIRVIYNEDGTKHISTADAVIAKANAALAPPEPTDEELLRMAASEINPYESCGITTGEYEAETGCAIEAYGSELIAFARAVLARYGTPTAQPVPVSERLPGPEDCDAERRCWWWNVTMDPDSPNWWSLESIEYIETEPYWLPHWALPVPTPAIADEMEASND